VHSCDSPTSTEAPGDDPTLIYGVVDGQGFIAETIGVPEDTEAPTVEPTSEPEDTEAPTVEATPVEGPEYPVILVPTPLPVPVVSPTPEPKKTLDDFVQFALRTVNSGQALYSRNGDATMTPQMGARAAGLGVRAQAGANQLQVAIGAAVGATKVEVLREDANSGAPKRVAEEVKAALNKLIHTHHIQHIQHTHTYAYTLIHAHIYTQVIKAASTEGLSGHLGRVTAAVGVAAMFLYENNDEEAALQVESINSLLSIHCANEEAALQVPPTLPPPPLFLRLLTPAPTPPCL
jgi:hypothetical protein